MFVLFLYSDDDLFAGGSLQQKKNKSVFSGSRLQQSRKIFNFYKIRIQSRVGAKIMFPALETRK